MTVRNYTQLFREPIDVAPSPTLERALAATMRRFRFCSYCGRQRGRRETCDGCGAPSVFVSHEQPPLLVVRSTANPYLDHGGFDLRPGSMIRASATGEVEVVYEGWHRLDPEAEAIRMDRAAGKTMGPGWCVVET